MITRAMDPAQASKTEVLNRLIPDVGTGLCLIAIAGAICWMLIRLRAFWRDDADGDASPRELLAQFRESQREGVLTAEEFRLIKSRLVRPAAPATETERLDSADVPHDDKKGLAPRRPD